MLRTGQLEEEVCLEHEVPGRDEVVSDRSAGFASEVRRSRWIVQEADDRVPEGAQVARIIDQEAALAVVDLFRDAADLARDHRPALPHRLRDGEAESFGQAVLDDDL